MVLVESQSTNEVGQSARGSGCGATGEQASYRTSLKPAARVRWSRQVPCGFGGVRGIFGAGLASKMAAMASLLPAASRSISSRTSFARR